MKNIVILVGSLRQKSHCKQIATFLTQTYHNQFNFEVPEIDFPHYNEDLALADKLPVTLTEFFETLDQADGVIMITPEYNHSISSVLKNAIDWASTTTVLVNKPCLIMAGSRGSTGAARAHSELRLILETMPMHVLPGNDVLISGFHDKFDDHGNINDESTKNFISSVMVKFYQYIEMVQSVA